MADRCCVIAEDAGDRGGGNSENRIQQLHTLILTGLLTAFLLLLDSSGRQGQLVRASSSLIQDDCLKSSTFSLLYIYVTRICIL